MLPLQFSQGFSYHFKSLAALHVLQNRGARSQSRQTWIVEPQLSHGLSYHFAAFSALQVLQKRGGLSQSRQTCMVEPHVSQDLSYQLAARWALQLLQNRGGLSQSTQTRIVVPQSSHARSYQSATFNQRLSLRVLSGGSSNADPHHTLQSSEIQAPPASKASFVSRRESLIDRAGQSPNARDFAPNSDQLTS